MPHPAQRQSARALRETRRAEGLCTACGATRGSDSTATLCARCREKSREYCRRYNETHPDARRKSWRAHQQAKRDNARAIGLCTACGKVPPAPGLAHCPACHQSASQRDTRHRDKKRRAEYPRYEGDPKKYPFRLSSERPQLSGKVHVLRFALDGWAYMSLMRMLKALRDEERAQNQYHRRDRLSQLVRECILQHERYPCPVHRQTEEMNPLRLGVSLDDRTLALLDTHAAQHYNGNRSAALRDFLIAARPRPQWVAKVGGVRHHFYPDESADT